MNNKNKVLDYLNNISYLVVFKYLKTSKYILLNPDYYQGVVHAHEGLNFKVDNKNIDSVKKLQKWATDRYPAYKFVIAKIKNFNNSYDLYTNKFSILDE